MAAIVGFCFCPPHTTTPLIYREDSRCVCVCLSLHPFFLQWVYNANCVRHLSSTTSSSLHPPPPPPPDRSDSINTWTLGRRRSDSFHISLSPPSSLLSLLLLFSLASPPPLVRLVFVNVKLVVPSSFLIFDIVFSSCCNFGFDSGLGWTSSAIFQSFIRNRRVTGRRFRLTNWRVFFRQCPQLNIGEKI